MHLLMAALLLAAMPAPQASRSLPWIFPGNFRERRRMSGLVVSGTVEETDKAGNHTVDSTRVTANVARLQVDHVFEGNCTEREQRFTWFAQRFETTGTGFVYSGPPLADFRIGRRYLVFLNRARSRWEVAMPVYAIEVELAASPPAGAVRCLPRAPLPQIYGALAEELERAALALPAPPEGMTGEAAWYFPYVFDLLGGCAERFYNRFMSSPSPELRGAASTWLGLIRSRSLACEDHLVRAPQ